MSGTYWRVILIKPVSCTRGSSNRVIGTALLSRRRCFRTGAAGTCVQRRLKDRHRGAAERTVRRRPGFCASSVAGAMASNAVLNGANSVNSAVGFVSAELRPAAPSSAMSVPKSSSAMTSAVASHAAQTPLGAQVGQGESRGEGLAAAP